MKVNFVKMQCAGNDYIFIDCAKYGAFDFGETAKKLSDRHFSVGGDGVIYIFPSDTSDAKMRIFNADGTEGKMCGNGVRCVAKYVYENSSDKKDNMKIETLSGIKDVCLLPDSDGRVTNAHVNMGKFKKLKEELVEISGKIRKVSLIDMGNLHAVLQVDNTDGADIYEIGMKVRKIKGFSETNVEICEKIPEGMKMRVLERGSGETLSCGTGACAVAAFATVNRIYPCGEPIKIETRGGVLSVTVMPDGTVWLCGDAATSFCGEVNV